MQRFYFTLLCSTLLACASQAQASSFSIRSGQSAEGLGQAYAGAASGGIGLGSMAWNPATITMFPGRNSEWNFTYIRPSADYKSSDPLTIGTANVLGVSANSGEIGGEGVFVPASYSAWQLNDRLWIGMTTGAPWGLRSKPENQNYLGQVYGRSSTVRSMNVSPTVGYQVNDWLSIGAALQVQYFKANLKQALTPAFGSPNTILEGDDIGFGYRFGATLKPWAGGTIGIGYRSSIRHTLEGDFTAPVTLNALVRQGDNPIKANLNLPDSVTFGLTQQVNDQWTVHLGTEWTNWSRFRRIPVVLQNSGVAFTSLNFEYDDSWYFALGADYAYNSALTFRAGVGYELSAVSDRVRNVRISDNDRLWLSLGGSYKWSDRLSFDLSYSHLFVKEAPVRIAPGHPDYVPGNPLRPIYIAEAKPAIDIVSFAIKYRWDAPAQPLRPISVKY